MFTHKNEYYYYYMSKNHTDLLIYIFQFSLFRYVLINYPIYFWNIQIVRYRTVVSNHLTFVCEYFPYKYITLADSHIMHALKFKRTKRVNKLIRLFIVVAVFFFVFWFAANKFKVIFADKQKSVILCRL